MVDVQLVSRGIRRHFVRDAMRAGRRKFFVDRGLQELAYEDRALPIGESQNISQPYMAALMIEAAEVKSGDRMLEVGARIRFEGTPASVRLASRTHRLRPSL
jgi:protein-L-isoaspartate O-methyltransferase